MPGEPVFAINAFAHDAGVACVLDGDLVFSVEEERLNREKKTGALPVLGLAEMTRRFNLPLAEVRTVAFPWRPWRLLRTMAGEVLRGWPTTLNLLRDEASPHLNRLAWRRFAWLKWILARRLNWRPRLVRVGHHLAHAANAYYLSPFDDAAILIMDGYGDDASLAVYEGRGSDLRFVSRNRFFDSLGMLYAAITKHLGWRTLHHEGTVMALAAYGSDRLVPAFRNLVTLLPEGRFRLDNRLLSFQRYGERQMVTPEFVKVFGPPRGPDDPIDDRHRDLANALQVTAEEIILHIARHLRERLGSRNLCLGGGVALNCQANARLAREAGFDRVFVSSSPSDTGTTLGAALVAARAVGSPRLGGAFPHASPYLGPDYSRAECLAALRAKSLPYRQVADPAELAARLIDEGAIVGWFQGRSEIGPRALGNRSILADARREDTPERLNATIKRRPKFRPYAPACLAEHVGACFEHGIDSPYMSFALAMRPEWRARAPAALHADGSARVQAIYPDLNPLFHALVSHFYRRTGVPMVINTSYNRVGEPIVDSPASAVATFCATGLDLLFLGDLVAWKPGSHWSVTG
jgi:carbamoyltransferase